MRRVLLRAGGAFLCPPHPTHPPTTPAAVWSARRRARAVTRRCPCVSTTLQDPSSQHVEPFHLKTRELRLLALTASQPSSGALRRCLSPPLTTELAAAFGVPCVRMTTHPDSGVSVVSYSDEQSPCAPSKGPRRPPVCPPAWCRRCRAVLERAWQLPIGGRGVVLFERCRAYHWPGTSSRRDSRRHLVAAGPRPGGCPSHAAPAPRCRRVGPRRSR